ncbi:peptidoglycan-binding domain-containing protein [Granulicella sp. dw_53]|uniref:peptidoglycan-binding domain-containing protein n=1 Tax=Granulicella sp. dw_53 TaxID=2719792 RepID=UPI001BD45D4A|nr:peptidoglycan-binding domain-containing protein [Granulicella sp. dw_53]
MRFGRILLSSTLLLITALPSFGLTHPRRGPTAPRFFTRHTKTTTKSNKQAAIAPERATEIQTALIKSGYLSGTPSGTWDATTKSAMQKLQGDNGWQTTLVPDSRAIIKLGLGPNQDVSLTRPTPEESRSPSASTY